MRVLAVIGALLALKTLLLAFDPTIRLYLGDSAAYLYGAMDDGRLPDDRSFTYSFLLRILVRPFEHLVVLGRWQSLFGAVTALVLYHLLQRRMGVRHEVACAAALLLAVEPAQIYYERMVLAETAGLLAFVMFFAAAAAYLASPRWWLLPVTAVLGLLAVTLRLNYLPVVLVISLALPLIPLLGARAPAGPSDRRILPHLGVAIVAVVSLHGAYCYWVGQIFSVPAGYLGRAGFQRLGLVVPLVKPEHFAAVGLPADFERHLRYPLADPHARMRHMWSPGGLVRELRQRSIDVEPVARQLSRLAVADDPMGVVRLGLFTVGDYFRAEQSQHALDDDLGRRTIPGDVLWSLRERWGYDATGLDTRTTLASRYFEMSPWWLVACLVTLPGVAMLNAIVHWRTRWRLPALLAALVGLGLVTAHLLFVPVALYRYLHPLPFFLILNAAPLLARWRRRALPAGTRALLS